MGLERRDDMLNALAPLRTRPAAMISPRSARSTGDFLRFMHLPADSEDTSPVERQQLSVEASSGDQEGFGLVMVEAMGCSCAVIASELPAVRDVIQDGRTGVLVSPGDVSALKGAIESLVARPEATLAIAKRGRCFGLEHFDWSVSINKFRRTFGELTGVGTSDGKSGSVSTLMHTTRVHQIDQGTPPRRGHAVMDLRSRDAKARKIEELLKLAPGNAPLRVLEIGTGSGGIANYFASHSELRCEVDAVDVSDMRQVKDGYAFTLVDGVKLPFPSGRFDLVISNHVIEHVGDRYAPRLHLEEIRRVLKPGGLGYLAVPNRWQLVEPHYRLAFLSCLPIRWRTPYLRFRRRGPNYDCRPLTVPALENLLREVGFSFRQEHSRALRLTYKLERPDAILYQWFFKHLPDGLYEKMRSVFPTLTYILRGAPD